jgi:hypothetical protein
MSAFAAHVVLLQGAPSFEPPGSQISLTHVKPRHSGALRRTTKSDSVGWIDERSKCVVISL